MRNYVTTYDPFFDLFFQPERSNKYHYIMDTDVIDNKDSLEMLVNLPNFKKEDVKVSLDNGYLTIEAIASKENKESNKNYLMRERRFGSYSRTYYVGEDIHMSDISGKLEDGVLSLTIKKPVKEEVKENRYLDIQ